MLQVSNQNSLDTFFKIIRHIHHVKNVVLNRYYMYVNLIWFVIAAAAAADQRAAGINNRMLGSMNPEINEVSVVTQTNNS